VLGDIINDYYAIPSDAGISAQHDLLQDAVKTNTAPNK